MAGRTSKYDPERMPILARQKMREGYTREQLASYFGVHRDTVKEWAKRYPAFSAALSQGQDFADARVEDSLFRRAVGFSYTEVAVEDGAEGRKRKRVRKMVVPDVTAQIFWLKNRKPKQWRDKIDVDTTVCEQAAADILDAAGKVLDADAYEQLLHALGDCQGGEEEAGGTAAD